MKNSKIIVTLIIAIMLLVSIALPVKAASYTFTFSVNPEKVNAKPGDTITVDLGMADIDQTGDGINAIQGDISYDENIFENVEIVTAGNNWSVSLNQSADSSLKGRFVINNMSNQKNTQVVAKLKAKIKSGVTASTATIDLKNVFSSYGTTETAKTNKTVTVNIQKSSQSNTNGNNSGSKNSTLTQKSSNAQNTAKNTNLPKAGLSSWIGVGIVVAIICAIIEFIRYKKIY